MTITLNDLKRAIAKFEEENQSDANLYDTELVVDEQRVSGLIMGWLQQGSSEYID